MLYQAVLLGSFLKYAPMNYFMLFLISIWTVVAGFYCGLMLFSLVDKDVRKRVKEMTGEGTLSHAKGFLMILVFLATEHMLFAMTALLAHLAILVITFDFKRKAR